MFFFFLFCVVSAVAVAALLDTVYRCCSCSFPCLLSLLLSTSIETQICDMITTTAIAVTTTAIVASSSNNNSKGTTTTITTTTSNNNKQITNFCCVSCLFPLRYRLGRPKRENEPVPETATAADVQQQTVAAGHGEKKKVTAAAPSSLKNSASSSRSTELNPVQQLLSNTARPFRSPVCKRGPSAAASLPTTTGSASVGSGVADLQKSSSKAPHSVPFPTSIRQASAAAAARALCRFEPMTTAQLLEECRSRSLDVSSKKKSHLLAELLDEARAQAEGRTKGSARISSVDDEYDEDKLMQKSLYQLQSMCKNQGIPQQGNKSHLSIRISAWYRAKNQSSATGQSLQPRAQSSEKYVPTSAAAAPCTPPRRSSSAAVSPLSRNSPAAAGTLSPLRMNSPAATGMTET